ncbi:MAG: hypothetical protein AAFN74_17150, partial [Myxococcota bacterium]
MSDHPTPPVLEAYFVGEASSTVAAHVAACDECQRAVAALEADRKAFLANESAAAFLRRPAIAAALAGDGAAESVETRNGLSGWLDAMMRDASAGMRLSGSTGWLGAAMAATAL